MNMPYVLGVEDPTQTHHWLLPEGYELLFGSIATGIVLGLLIWKAGPAIKKGFVARTHRVQQELDDSANALAAARDEAARIRTMRGDIDSERRQLLAEADERAAALVTDGRARLANEIAEMEAKADSDIAAVGSRASEELRAEIGRLAVTAADQIVEQSLDDETRQRLVEDFIARVGASRAAEVAP
jgi:F-type H+-transporting ATPase subunit b